MLSEKANWTKICQQTLIDDIQPSTISVIMDCEGVESESVNKHDGALISMKYNRWLLLLLSSAYLKIKIKNK